MTFSKLAGCEASACMAATHLRLPPSVAACMLLLHKAGVVRCCCLVWLMWPSAALVQVLLVGGATRMPGVRQLVKNMTGLDAREFLIDPDEVCWEHA